MKTIITGKNYTPSDKLKDIIEKKFAKLDKYFSDDITANVVTIKEKGGYKVEATINTKGNIFRAETKASDPYDCVDRCIEKLSTQMSNSSCSTICATTKLYSVRIMRKTSLGFCTRMTTDLRERHCA